MGYNYYLYKDTLGLRDVTTVSNGPETPNEYGLGANEVLSRVFENSMRHSSTEMAVNNCLGRFAQNPAASGVNFVGHGSPGILETGSGQMGWDYNKLILNWNDGFWLLLMANIAAFHFPQFSIYSCKTGAGEDGADLLYKLAVLLGRPVRARTGNTIAWYRHPDGACWLEFQSGSTWQTADPDHRPVAIDPPYIPYEFGKTSIYFTNKGKLNRINIDEIQNLIIKPIQGNRAESTITGSDKDHFLKLLFVNQPIFSDGQLLALITHYISFEFQGNKFDFTIYNHEIAKRNDTNEYYYASSLFEKFLKSIY